MAFIGAVTQMADILTTLCQRNGHIESLAFCGDNATVKGRKSDREAEPCRELNWIHREIQATGERHEQ